MVSCEASPYVPQNLVTLINTFKYNLMTMFLSYHIFSLYMFIS